MQSGITLGIRCEEKILLATQKAVPMAAWLSIALSLFFSSARAAVRVPNEVETQWFATIMAAVVLTNSVVIGSQTACEGHCVYP